jgi:hypothetical protein
MIVDALRFGHTYQETIKSDKYIDLFTLNSLGENKIHLNACFGFCKGKKEKNA